MTLLLLCLYVCSLDIHSNNMNWINYRTAFIATLFFNWYKTRYFKCASYLPCLSTQLLCCCGLQQSSFVSILFTTDYLHSVLAVALVQTFCFLPLTFDPIDADLLTPRSGSGSILPVPWLTVDFDSSSDAPFLRVVAAWPLLATSSQPTYCYGFIIFSSSWVFRLLSV